MAAKARRVRFYTVPGFNDRYKRFLPDDQVERAMHVFNQAKRNIPPTDLPTWMKDHKLHGQLAAFYECHLANDVLLVYTHEDDVVTLIDCCTHIELTGTAVRIIRRGHRVAIQRARRRHTRH